MIKRLSCLLPVFLLLLFGCSENPSEVTSKISSPVVDMSSGATDEELNAPSFDELEMDALEELSKGESTILHEEHERHFSFLVGKLRTHCGSEGNLIWGKHECRPVAIAIVNTGGCPIVVELKCGDDRIAIEDPRPGDHVILHGEGNSIVVHCLEHGDVCKARYAIVWL